MPDNFERTPFDSDDERPGKGTTRPHTWVPQPREESQRKLMRLARDHDADHQLKIQWLTEVQLWIASTSEFRDHWRDPRWELDDLPFEWTWRGWRSKKIREKLLRLRGLRV